MKTAPKNSNFGFATACLSHFFLIAIRMWGSGLLRLFIINSREPCQLKAYTYTKIKAEPHKVFCWRM